MGLYKGKFGIGLYKRIRKVSDTDELVQLFESVQEFATFLGKSIQQGYDILYRHHIKQQKAVIIDGQVCEIAFIDMRD